MGRVVFYDSKIKGGFSTGFAGLLVSGLMFLVYKIGERVGSQNEKIKNYD